MAARTTQLPFLYHTRTILRRPRPSTFGCPLQKCFGSASEPRSHQNEANIRQIRPKTHKDHGSDIEIRSSITPSERKAFEAILRSSKPPTKSAQSQPPLVDATDIDVDKILEMFGTSIKSQHDISHTSTSPVEANPNHDNPSSSTSRSGPPEGDGSVMAIVHQQMHEIVDALQQAAASTQQPGDIALWHACEAHVFSLGQGFHQQPIYHPPKFLGPPKFTFTAKHSDMPVEILEKEQKRHRAEFEAKEHGSASNQQSVTASSPGEGAQDPVPDSRQARAVLHHLYPAALLFALRLFARTFPSSHFAFNLLPRIRELGHTSYVLGASTQFYNSLMSLKWHRHSSLREIHQLLSEMERGGVEFNEETGRVIRQIVNERREADLASSGSTGRTAAWWARHEQAFWYPRILDWQNVVADQLSSSHEAWPALASPSGVDSQTHSGGSNGPCTQRSAAAEPFSGVLDEATRTLRQMM